MQFKDQAQYHAVKRKKEQELKKMFPELTNRSGIYIFRRPSYYIGKATDILGRTAGHALGKTQYIDHSIKKWGFTPIGQNGGGWQVSVLEYCSDDMLNEREQYWIDQYIKRGCKLYNIESGGQDGKTDINQRAERKGYRQGKQDGYDKAILDIVKYFDLKMNANALDKRKGNVKKEPFELIKTIQNLLTANEKCGIMCHNQIGKQDAETPPNLENNKEGIG